jgi:hypothetical protein
MTDDPDRARKNYAKRLQQEYAELDDPAVKAQMQLDRWWQNKLDDEFEENDWVEIGGFWERKSAMPSYHRSKRDSDF